MKLFKYQVYLDECDCECPPLETFIETSRKCFRWVHQDIHHSNNFLPVGLIETSRKADNCNELCGFYALSFFETLERAEARYRSLCGKYATFSERIGTAVAVGEIYPRDGVASRPAGKWRHFDLHEFENCNLVTRFKVIKVIKLNE